LPALAGQLETVRASRGPAVALSGAARPVPVDPAPRVEVARARATAAQIWDDSRDEYDPPTQTQRR